MKMDKYLLISIVTCWLIYGLNAESQKVGSDEENEIYKAEEGNESNDLQTSALKYNSTESNELTTPLIFNDTSLSEYPDETETNSLYDATESSVESDRHLHHGMKGEKTPAPRRTHHRERENKHPGKAVRPPKDTTRRKLRKDIRTAVKKHIKSKQQQKRDELRGVARKRTVSDHGKQKRQPNHVNPPRRKTQIEQALRKQHRYIQNQLAPREEHMQNLHKNHDRIAKHKGRGYLRQPISGGNAAVRKLSIDSRRLNRDVKFLQDADEYCKPKKSARGHRQRKPALRPRKPKVGSRQHHTIQIIREAD